jgi:hypothetical protein
MSSAEGAKGEREAPRRRLRLVTSALALASLLGGAGLPLLEIALAQEAAPFCGRGGRCCCAESARRADDGPCLRRGCGCDEPEGATVALGPLRLDAVLEAKGAPARAEAGPRAQAPAATRLLSRPHAPPVPPPRRSPSA